MGPGRRNFNRCATAVKGRTVDGVWLRGTGNQCTIRGVWLRDTWLGWSDERMEQKIKDNTKKLEAEVIPL